MIQELSKFKYHIFTLITNELKMKFQLGWLQLKIFFHLAKFRNCREISLKTKVRLHNPIISLRNLISEIGKHQEYICFWPLLSQIHPKYKWAKSHIIIYHCSNTIWEYHKDACAGLFIFTSHRIYAHILAKSFDG